MDFLSTILYPLEWLVANVMVIWHQGLSFLGMNPDAGITWALAIVGLVVTIRIALIPLFVKQIKASRAMQVIAPELRAVQDKYKGKKDQASREAMSRETMELYAKHKTNPFSSCLPLLIQTPIFFALFRVLNYWLEGDRGTIGLLSQELIDSAHNATLFGAQLSETFLSTGSSTSAKILSAVLIVAMVATTFLTQHQLTQKNMPASALEGPMAQQQKILMYILPFIFVLSGPNFPVGVLIYWTTTNLWTMGQQFYVIRNNPTPGSEAERRLKERRAEKAKRKGITAATVDGEGTDVTVVEDESTTSGQRQQPKRKNRKKR
ncbi:membrane protein insertase YidC [Demequina capsici]|uniref:Membrane protein insertase YidC n=1 Tax=Demequina capsici TaxID=3075620 RepID=A0AA96JCV5_9MICO|nr:MULTISPECIES: membrane protein insertase YidC [unclassified Demequina]WNM24486.1 membrane protein insertase YidC [Demequina sp. OYTSA14]WNM27316.1 membrane protein insertase YidC [Demequina sp. PMTSA13]